MVADWLESYATNQRIVHWTNSTLSGKPKYDLSHGAWEVSVDRNGTIVHLQPSHIVIATGALNAPYMPSLPGRSRFSGPVLHSSSFDNASAFKGKRVIVVGAGNSSIDVCQDLATSGVASVTMVQRGVTIVVSRQSVTVWMKNVWASGEALATGDFKWLATPLGHAKQVAPSRNNQLEEELQEKLRKGGLKLSPMSRGIDALTLYHERGGGMFLPRIS